VRLLYVAMTRAKDRLVLAGVWPQQMTPRPADQARSHMEILLSRGDLPSSLPFLWEGLAAGEQAWTFADAAGALWKFPALRPGDEVRLAAEPARPSLPGPEEIALVSASLRGARIRAAARMARPYGGAASEEAHDLLRQRQAERLAGEAPERPWDHGTDREVAMAAGGALHRALEEWDLAAEAAAEVRRQRGLLPAYLASLTQGDELARALPVAESLVEAFAGGPLLGRLQGLRQHILSRELPVLLPPGEGEGSPVGAVAGTIDLLYRDPGDGRLVIADYKTDDVETAGQIRDRAAVYAPQGAAYQRAVREALELAEAPRFELWFLRAGEVVSPAVG
jgi:ATP-dependent exoDNAse (exonuclease V) beta subunit